MLLTECDVNCLGTEVKKQAEVANNLQTQHGRRLVKYYFQQWTEKTHQMKRAKELHNRKIVKRSVDDEFYVTGLPGDSVRPLRVFTLEGQTKAKTVRMRCWLWC